MLKYYLFYKDNILIYKGEHFYDKKNGKGKEYNRKNGSLIFEGEYLKDHKLRGKTYFPNGNIEFEGEFMFDRKWNGKGYDENGKLLYELINGNGKVREYNSYWELIYDGEYKNGIRNGKGKEYISGKLIFEGEYLNGKKNGKGKEYENDKLIFEGEYLNGNKNNKKDI